MRDIIRRRRHSALSISLALVGLVISSCDRGQMVRRDLAESQRRYEQALKHGLATIPTARQFQELFPDSRNYYSYYRPGAGSPILNCETTLFDRYWLTLQIPVVFDKTRAKVVSWGDPALFLNEYTSVTRNERFHIEEDGLHRRFGLPEWQKLSTARGDFGAIGVELTRDKPVPNFAAYWADQKSKT
jgi:hypothetical protein